MYVASLRDGTVIEIKSSDGYSGPDGKPGCQRTSMNVPWFRFIGERWQVSPVRSNAKLAELARISDNRDEFIQLLEIA